MLFEARIIIGDAVEWDIRRVGHGTKSGTYRSISPLRYFTATTTTDDTRRRAVLCARRSTRREQVRLAYSIQHRRDIVFRGHDELVVQFRVYRVSLIVYIEKLCN